MFESKDATNRIHHTVPAWVPDGAVFHVRIRVDRNAPPLTEARRATALLQSAAKYNRECKWFCHLFLLMPDHCHALLCFPLSSPMARVVGTWKRWHTRFTGTGWQDNFFDHRIRTPAEFDEKAAYIRRNPVVKNLCPDEPSWPWVLDQQSMPHWSQAMPPAIPS